jgi:hypothetical protein
MTVHAEAGKSSEWYTPEVYIDAARITMGSIMLDPYSSPRANKTVQAVMIGTKKNPIDPQKWRAMTAFVNPPYSDYRGQADQILGFMLDAHLENRIKQFIALVQQSVLYQPNAQRILRAGSVCLCDHRIQFIDGETGIPQKSPPQTNAFLYLAPWNRAHRFEYHFKQFGAVLHSHIQIETEDYYA